MVKYVDLHLHSYFSDGTMSPNEIIDEAIKAGVGVIAITDHDILDGSKELLRFAKGRDITCISGVELDAVEGDVNFHILGYGVDLDNKEFNDNVKKNRARLEEVNERLIFKMEKENLGVSYEDYIAFSYDRTLGGWKALHYFIEKGLTSTLPEGILLYAQNNISYSCVNFPKIEEVCRWIHHAGGKAVLAHPGRVIKQSEKSLFLKELNAIIDQGMDGIECYYPTHTKEITEMCLDVCKKRNLIITSGSDCHGGFEKSVIGQMKVTMDQVGFERLYKLD